MSSLRVQLPEKLGVLFEPHRYKCLHGGRGSGKSWGVARALLVQGAARPLRILCTREIQRTIADSVHRLLADQISALGLDSFYQVLEGEIRGRNGTLFLFAGLRQQDVHKIKSFEGVDICWVEEAHVVTKRSWDILIPTIRKDGSEIWITFNPELDSDETFTRFVENPPPDSALIPMNWRDNPWFPETLNQERLLSQRRDSKEDYENIWEGKPRTTVAGAIYRHEILALIEDRRIRPVPYDPMLKVHTVWDLGWNDQTSIIMVQRLRGEARIIDYVEDSHRTLSDYVAELEKRKYRWGTDYLPHDGQAKDVKGGKSAEDILRDLQRNPMIVPNLDVESGIKVARLVFPRCYFDEDKTKRLVECLKRYRRQIPTTTDEPAKPLHDEFSHAADAFRYMSIVIDQMGNEDAKPIVYPKGGIA